MTPIQKNGRQAILSRWLLNMLHYFKSLSFSHEQNVLKSTSIQKGVDHKRCHHFFWDFYPLLPLRPHFYWISLLSEINFLVNPPSPLIDDIFYKWPQRGFLKYTNLIILSFTRLVTFHTYYCCYPAKLTFNTFLLNWQFCEIKQLFY